MSLSPSPSKQLSRSRFTSRSYQQVQLMLTLSSARFRVVGSRWKGKRERERWSKIYSLSEQMAERKGEERDTGTEQQNDKATIRADQKRGG